MKFLFRHSSNSRKLIRQKFHNELACACILCSLHKQKCRLKSTTTNEWWHFGQSEQHKSSVLFPIQSEKRFWLQIQIPDSGFFACYLWKDCIMPSSRKLACVAGGILSLGVLFWQWSCHARKGSSQEVFLRAAKPSGKILPATFLMSFECCPLLSPCLEPFW